VILPTDTDRLSIEVLRRGLSTDVLGRHIYLFGTVRSTNAVMRSLAQAGATEGTVVIAESQTAGRGFAGASWPSPPGVNLYLSVLFRPTLTPSAVLVFAFITSLALTEAIRAQGLPAAIKWPNDVLLAGRKAGGGLVEYTTNGPGVTSVILGVSVNVNVERPQLQAALGADADDTTSLREAAGREIDRNAFAATVLNLVERWLRTYIDKGPAAVLDAWRERDALNGRHIEVRNGGETVRGEAVRVDTDGSLIVKDAQGRVQRVLTGAIRVLDEACKEA
jgi:BirA family transcriptional regulator, biotin operon repressor / biotin---[acetyl-CoA-carboxylase] ligase